MEFVFAMIGKVYNSIKSRSSVLKSGLETLEDFVYSPTGKIISITNSLCHQAVDATEAFVYEFLEETKHGLNFFQYYYFLKNKLYIFVEIAYAFLLFYSKCFLFIYSINRSSSFRCKNSKRFS